MNRFVALCGVVLAAGALYMGASVNDKPKVAPPVTPEPCPICPKEPDKPRKPWLTDEALSVGSNAPDGTEPQIDYPAEQWIRNIGSRKDGAGMCVFSSFEMTCRYAGLESFRGFRDWCAQNYPGGGTASKLDRLVTAYCKAKNIPKPLFVQYEGPSAELIEMALRTGRMPCVTLYHSKRYGGLIFHMVNAGSLDEHKYSCIIDNNQLGKDEIPPYEWFDGKQAFVNAVSYRGSLWCVVLLRPGAPTPVKH